MADARQITVNEALAWMKTLRARHAELVALRDANSVSSKRYFGAHADKETETKPVYDVKLLDRAVQRVAREIRVLDAAIKASNAVTTLAGYEQDESALGSLD